MSWRSLTPRTGDARAEAVGGSSPGWLRELRQRTCCRRVLLQHPDSRGGTGSLSSTEITAAASAGERTAPRSDGLASTFISGSPHPVRHRLPRGASSGRSCGWAQAARHRDLRRCPPCTLPQACAQPGVRPRPRPGQGEAEAGEQDRHDKPCASWPDMIARAPRWRGDRHEAEITGRHGHDHLARPKNRRRGRQLPDRLLAPTWWAHSRRAPPPGTIALYRTAPGRHPAAQARAGPRLRRADRRNVG